jgi:5-methyltetrahydropteroyltriglutamate--homocysteine methyltransferase
MKRSADRIVTTHAGSLPRPPELIDLNRAGPEAPGFAEGLRTAVRDVVERQLAAGITVVNDGEYGKAMRGTIDYGAWMSYAYARLTGWEPGPPSAVPAIALRRERQLFPGAYAEVVMSNAPPAPTGPPVFTGPISYCGYDLVRRDVENLQAALEDVSVEEAFITAVAPGSFGRGQNRYYPNDEAYLEALGNALREEYQVIVDAGFVLQIDDPGLPDTWDQFNPEPPLEEYRRYAAARVEALNHALRGIPEDRVRYHICWGSWHGPHTTDLPLRAIVDLLLQVHAGAYSVEAGNVRHEHEWKVWRDARLPDGKLLIPGVVSHATNVVEHPEVVADRLVRYAQIVGRENVIAGTDCGLGGRIHPEIVWAKLRALHDGAALASAELWGT